jgi:hypothetical protein
MDLEHRFRALEATSTSEASRANRAKALLSDDLLSGAFDTLRANI